MSLNIVKMAREAGFHVGDQFAAGCSEDDLRKLAIIITRELNENQPPQHTWVGLTDKEIDQGLCRTNYAMQTADAWRDGVDWAIKQLREKNNG